MLCFEGEKGVGVSTGKPLHYKGCLFHRVIKGFMAQVCSLSLSFSLFDICILCYLLRINNVGIDVFVATYST